nr:ATP-binding cassette domain-containing protein [Klebsiella pneumoniae]ELA0723886.1 ATP-binding cassette domain-containing protein [Klebsiella pneumoniae]ELA1968786.1 ATP-binding cassette domain-containing protein [Klebsiella pneumoniae]
MTTPLVSFNHLSVSFAGERSRVRAVQEVSFTIQAGQTVGVVGESGCGKSVTAMALMGLLPPQTARIDGAHRRRRDPLRGPRSAAAESQTDGRSARSPAGNDFSGTDVGPQPGVDHRGAAVRTADPPPQRHAESRLASGHPAVKRGRPGARGQPDDPLSSPAFRRHAAAGDDRHGAELSAQDAAGVSGPL